MDPQSIIEGKNPSKWAVLAATPERILPILRDERWYTLPLAPRPGGPDPERVLWTDDRSDVISILKHL